MNIIRVESQNVQKEFSSVKKVEKIGDGVKSPEDINPSPFSKTVKPFKSEKENLFFNGPYRIGEEPPYPQNSLHLYL